MRLFSKIPMDSGTLYSIFSIFAGMIGTAIVIKLFIFLLLVLNTYLFDISIFDSYVEFSMAASCACKKAGPNSKRSLKKGAYKASRRARIAESRDYYSTKSSSSGSTDLLNNNSSSVLALLIKLTNAVMVYSNAELDRANILKDNQNRMGIYVWFNNQTSQFYVGSSKNLKDRLRSYFNPAFLDKPSNRNMIISRALLKYNYSSFSLLVVEYCDESLLTAREQYWIDTLQPDYNIFKFAYRSTGYKHTDAARKLMSELAQLRTHSADTKAKISQALKGENNPFFNQKHSIETIKKISTANSASSIYLYNEFKVLMFIFPSLRNLASEIKANSISVANSMEEQSLFRGGWYISRTPYSDQDLPFITDSSSQEYIDLVNNMISSSHIKKVIFVYSALDNQFIKKFEGVMEAQRSLNISHETIKKYAQAGTSYRDYLFSYHRFN